LFLPCPMRALGVSFMVRSPQRRCILRDATLH
jgi:hypothetical protein